MSDTTSPSQLPSVHLVSFGYLHGEPPAADIVVDLRALLHDPARARDGGLLDLDGRHPAVRDAVMTTPGARDLAFGVASMVDPFCMAAGKSVTIAFGCAGGRHRSVALAEHVARSIASASIGGAIPVWVEHQHVQLPRVLRDGDDERRVR